MLNNEYRFVEKDGMRYHNPFLVQLQAMLKMPEVQEQLCGPGNCHLRYTEFRDGAHFQKPFFGDHSDALLFCLYHEIVNPIGSHCK